MSAQSTPQASDAGALVPNESMTIDTDHNTAQHFAASQCEHYDLPDTTFAITTPSTPSLRTGRYSKFCLRMTCIGGMDMQSAADNAKLVVANKTDAEFAKKSPRDMNTMPLPIATGIDLKLRKKVRARPAVSMLPRAASTMAKGMDKDPTATKKLQARSPVPMLPQAASTSAEGLDKDPTATKKLQARSPVPMLPRVASTSAEDVNKDLTPTKKVRARSPVSMLLMAASMVAEGVDKDTPVAKKSRAYLCSKCGAEKKGHQCPFAPENMTKSAFRLVHPKRSHKSLVTLRKAAARVTV